MSKKVMKKPSIKKPAAAPALLALRHAKSSWHLDVTEGDEECLSDAETLIMGAPNNENMKPSQAPRAEASEDVPNNSTISDPEVTPEAPGDAPMTSTNQCAPIGETC